MKYNSVADLAHACINACIVPITENEKQEILRLWEVYRDALDNPPEGVIGVGRFTYAEQQMALAQGEKHEV